MKNYERNKVRIIVENIVRKNLPKLEKMSDGSEVLYDYIMSAYINGDRQVFIPFSNFRSEILLQFLAMGAEAALENEMANDTDVRQAIISYSCGVEDDKTGVNIILDNEPLPDDDCFPITLEEPEYEL